MSPSSYGGVGHNRMIYFPRAELPEGETIGPYSMYGWAPQGDTGEELASRRILAPAHVESTQRALVI